MGGGFAYVLDERGDFAEKRCNLTSVALGPLGEDEGLVRALIERHVTVTGSPRGQWVLENWAQMLGKFLKVSPRESIHAKAPKVGTEANKTERPNRVDKRPAIFFHEGSKNKAAVDSTVLNFFKNTGRWNIDSTDPELIILTSRLDKTEDYVVPSRAKLAKSTATGTATIKRPC